MQQEIELTTEIQRLLNLLHMNTSIYNIETRIGIDGTPYIMEVSPRGGGNRLAEMLRMATGTDLITAAVRASVGDEVNDIEQHPYNGHWAEVVLHADVDGIFESLVITEEFEQKHVVESDLWVTNGDEVRAFRGANDAIGTLVLNFDTEEELVEALKNQRSWMKVVIR